MTILIGNYEFDGPYRSVIELEEGPGLYAVLQCEGEDYDLIHVAQADNIKERIELMQPEDTSASRTILLAACYTRHSSARERRTMVEEIQREFGDQS